MEIQNIVLLCIGAALIVAGLFTSMKNSDTYKTMIKKWSKYPKATATIKGFIPYTTEDGKGAGQVCTADLYVDGEMVDAIHCDALTEALTLRKDDEVKVYYRPISVSDDVLNTVDKMRSAYEAITGEDFKGEAPKYEFVVTDNRFYRNENKKCFLYPLGILGIFGIALCAIAIFVPIVF